MVLCIRTNTSNAQRVKNKLLEEGILHPDFKVKHDDEFLYFALKQKPSDCSLGEFVDLSEDELVRNSKNSRIARPFKEVLSKILTEEEMSIAKTAYDHLGEIAIIEVPESLRFKEELIAKSLLDSNPLIKTVLRKDGIHDGVFRAQKMKFLAGKNTKIAEYRENGCVLEVNVEEVYFSARLSTERKRISEQIKNGEDVLVMFSGAGPYPCVFCKKSPAKSIVGVEINPAGHEFGLKNCERNKCTKVELFCGDVRSVVPSLNKTFDRIVMPLPKTAEEFLDVAIPVARTNAIIHLYAFYHEDEFYKAKEEIERYCNRFGRRFEILDSVKAGQHAPRTWRICVDFKLLD